MLPNIPLGGLSLPTKPLLVLLGFYLVLWLGSKSAESLGIDGDHVWNWGGISAIAGLVFGRLAYAARYPQAYLNSPLSLLSPRLGAFVPSVAIVGGIFVGYLYLHRKRIPLGAFVDALVPGLTLGWAIYALANFMAGDAYGMPSTLPWAVEMWGEMRHPVQVYEMVAALLTTIWLFARPAPRGAGIWGWRILLAYSLAHLFLDTFRGDSFLIMDGYRLSQFLALGGVILALGGLSRYAPRASTLTEATRGRISRKA